MRKSILGCIFYLVCNSVAGQTLQQVTNLGNTTTNQISAASFTTYGSSFAGVSLPNSIYSLSGITINGNIADNSHNGITYQSGGGGGAAIGFFRGGSYNTAIDFYTTDYYSSPGNISHRMRIAENGNIGIGTTNPLNTLDIVGSSSDGVASAGNIVRFKDASDGFIIGANDAGDYSFIQGIDAHDFSLQPNGGNVGIGTATPDAKLTVAGKIHSQEVKVSVSAGADFVFDNDYRLPSLTETESFIKENKRLPEIASAEDMKKNGLALGEMNIKLLQKIEELTLHLIEQDKRTILQAAELKQLKAEIRRLKSDY